MKKEPRIEYTTLFIKQRKTAPREVKEAFQEALRLYLDDPNHPALRNHELMGALAGYRSLDVTGDYRALFREIPSGQQVTIVFHLFGTHEELYGK